MNLRDAAAVLDDNYNCVEGSFLYKLYEECRFSPELFWTFYDSVIAIAREALVSGRNRETAMKVAFVYQNILKEMIYHFDGQDLYRCENFPPNYTEYLERLDGAFTAYFQGTFCDESHYRLKRP